MQNRDEKDEDEDKELSDKFAQTFYKYMHNLSNRKFIDIINTPVDHEDRSLIFYQWTIIYPKRETRIRNKATYTDERNGITRLVFVNQTRATISNANREFHSPEESWCRLLCEGREISWRRREKSINDTSSDTMWFVTRIFLQSRITRRERNLRCMREDNYDNLAIVTLLTYAKACETSD